MAINGNSRPKMLTREEEAKLVEQMLSGCNKARNKLVMNFTPLVVKCARRYVIHGFNFEDLYQEGISAALAAAEYFDPEKEATFGTYIKSAIWQAMQRCVRKERLVKLPTEALQAKPFIERLERTSLNIKGKLPFDFEITDKLGFSLSELKYLRCAFRASSTSLEEKLSMGGVLTIADLLVNDTAMNPESALLAKEALREIKSNVEEILNRLNNDPKISPRNKSIFLDHYGLGTVSERADNKELARRHGISRQAIEHVLEVTWKRLVGYQVNERRNPFIKARWQTEMLAEIISAC